MKGINRETQNRELAEEVHRTLACMVEASGIMADGAELARMVLGSAKLHHIEKQAKRILKLQERWIARWRR